MRVLDLFSGIGGLSLAAHWAGWETAAFCEIDPFCRKVLKKHWSDVPCFEDIHNLTRGDIDGPIDIVCGGFPCQPFSTAGLQRGDQDDRFLWPEMLRVISEFRPAWVVGENVTGIISMALDQAISDLEGIRYTVRAFNIPAVALDAQHERQRIWIVAHATSARLQAMGNPLCNGKIKKKTRRESDIFTRPTNIFKPKIQQISSDDSHRAVDGVPARVDRNRSKRIKALGNSIVPQVAYQIFDAINKAEASSMCAENRKKDKR